LPSMPVEEYADPTTERGKQAIRSYPFLRLWAFTYALSAASMRVWRPSISTADRTLVLLCHKLCELPVNEGLAFAVYAIRVSMDGLPLVL
jgi:hypothetical protein